MPKTKALILAGGYGTRLKPLTINLPKPMVPFANRPILEHSIRLLTQAGISQIHLLLHYQPEKIIQYFENRNELGVNLYFNQTEEDLGTAGSVKKMADELQTTFIVMNGDVVTDVNIAEILKFHQKKGGLATIFLAKVKNPLPFGIAILDDDSRIKEFVEKPSYPQMISDLINAGIYVFEPEILRYIPENHPASFAMDIFPLLLQDSVPVYGYVYSGYWHDIGDLHQYLYSQHEYLNGTFSLPAYPVKIDRLNTGKDFSCHKNVTFEGTVITGDQCVVEEGSRIVRSIIGSNVKIGAGVAIYDSVIWSGVTIGAGTRIVNDVIAEGSVIGEHVYFDDHVFVGEKSRIGALSVLKSNVKIWPEKEVESGSTVTSSMVWGDRWLRDFFIGPRVMGLVNREISPEFGAKLGAAFGAYLGKGETVLVSWDGSAAARMINRAIICGLMSTGVHVGDLRVMPAPVLRYALQTGTAEGGVQVSRARRKDNFLEIVFFQANGQNLSAQQVKSVERLFIQEDFSRVDFKEIGQLDFPVRVVESYQEQYLKNLATKQIENAKFKIVIDYSFGPASLILPSLLSSLDCEVIALNAYLDTKHTVKRWSDFRYALLQLGNIVTSLKADAGFLIDPATERIFVVDEEGHFLKNEYLLVLITRLFLQVFRHSAIGMPASTPMILYKFAEQSGTHIINTQIDLRSIAEIIRKHQLSYVSDGDGRFIFPEFHFASDGMFAIGKILELLALNDVRFKDLRKSIPAPIMDRKRIPVARDNIGQILRELVDSAQTDVVTTLDGVKFTFPDGWLLVTPTQPTPAVSLIAEGVTRERVNRILDEYTTKISEINRSELNLPVMK